mmetsp:Transcript_20789/g.35707  ORF Transcript_20789/g.35707 Transcript_20789/m.35707 type:complete len:405 (-) Transcript_20789:65-1279(-)|eukprot:CAMPEP_0196654006 /NCGR_PEP_ID=MMETSP1086-20130531/3675_1 /TAXON_ID=77921 /ORGANISM="Cyanoptyche  gloeocystis , Strain SAG4.97" /LENGTH=404 /DNA_ID=CAMNT_0041985507 /DNA_START=182 /DNA_END=1396 /DNA_ORIENTATION=+
MSSAAERMVSYTRKAQNCGGREGHDVLASGSAPVSLVHLLAEVLGVTQAAVAVRANDHVGEGKDGEDEQGIEEDVVLPEVTDVLEVCNLRREQREDASGASVGGEGLRAEVHDRYGRVHDEKGVEQERVHHCLPNLHGVDSENDEVEAKLHVAENDGPEEVECKDRVGEGAEQGEDVVKLAEVLVEELRGRRLDEHVEQDVQQPTDRDHKRDDAKENPHGRKQRIASSLFVLSTQELPVLIEKHDRLLVNVPRFAVLAVSGHFQSFFLQTPSNLFQAGCPRVQNQFLSSVLIKGYWFRPSSKFVEKLERNGEETDTGEQGEQKPANKRYQSDHVDREGDSEAGVKRFDHAIGTFQRRSIIVGKVSNQPLRLQLDRSSESVHYAKNQGHDYEHDEFDLQAFPQLP